MGRRWVPEGRRQVRFQKVRLQPDTLWCLLSREVEEENMSIFWQPPGFHMVVDICGMNISEWAIQEDLNILLNEDMADLPEVEEDKDWWRWDYQILPSISSPILAKVQASIMTEDALASSAAQLERNKSFSTSLMPILCKEQSKNTVLHHEVGILEHKAVLLSMKYNWLKLRNGVLHKKVRVIVRAAINHNVTEDVRQIINNPHSTGHHSHLSYYDGSTIHNRVSSWWEATWKCLSNIAHNGMKIICTMMIRQRSTYKRWIQEKTQKSTSRDHWFGIWPAATPQPKWKFYPVDPLRNTKWQWKSPTFPMNQETLKIMGKRSPRFLHISGPYHPIVNNLSTVLCKKQSRNYVYCVRWWTSKIATQK